MGPQLASVLPFFQPVNAKRLNHVSKGMQSPQKVPVPPRRVGPHTMASHPQLSMSGKKMDNVDSQPPFKTIDDGSSDNMTKGLPPPVNRADKPKIPTKQFLVAGKTNRELLVPAADERASPFSTPPSSDEGIELGSDKPDRLAASRIESSSTQGRQVAPDSGLQYLHGALHPSDQIVAPKLQSSDARRLGFTQGNISHHIMADNAPGFPPRRAQGQRRSVQNFTASKGKQDRKSVPGYGTTLLQHTLTSPPDILPPPKRASTLTSSSMAHAERSHLSPAIEHGREVTSYPTPVPPDVQGRETASHASAALDYPEVANSNRRHPYLKRGIREIDTNYDTRLIDTCGRYVCTTGHLTRIWDLNTGEVVLSLGHAEKETRVTALAFKPGISVHEEGCRLWLGTNYGDIQEVDTATQNVAYTKTGVHDRREIVRIYRYQSSMWTLDDSGKLCVWPGDQAGLPNLQRSPFFHRVPKGHTFSIIIQETLWMATGKDIRIFRPHSSESASFSITREPLTQSSVGNVTSGAVIGGQLDRVYFGHADGKVTIYSITELTCLGIVSVSIYKISSLAGAGFHLWAGYNTGAVHVYDTRTRPWTTRKDWPAHGGPILSITVDRSSLWKDGVLRVVSLGADNTVRFWDGTLEDDWLGRQ